MYVFGVCVCMCDVCMCLNVLVSIRQTCVFTCSTSSHVAICTTSFMCCRHTSLNCQTYWFGTAEGNDSKRSILLLFHKHGLISVGILELQASGVLVQTQ